MNKPDYRPQIPKAKVTGETKAEEEFQNVSLRPIIKQVHKVLIMHFCAHLKTKQNTYFKLSDIDKSKYIIKIFESDSAYKKELRGIIIGHFTTDEFNKYLSFKPEVHRRINKIVLQRLLSSQNEFNI